MGFTFFLFGVIFFSSLILTMVGLGGGLIFSPFLVLVGFSKPMAVSVSLFLNGIAAVSAAITYLRKGMVDFAVSVPLIIASSLGAPLGAFTTHLVELRLFTLILAVVIFLAALRMLFTGKISEKQGEAGKAKRIIGGGVIGLVIGFMGGLLGIGGGVFVVPLLVYFLKVPTKTAAATSIFIVCFSSFSGFAVHASLAQLDWSFLLLAALFSFAGGQIGSRLMSEKLKGRGIRMIFGVVLLLFCARLLYNLVG
jgi:uncharacterized membrane protein YfcA